MIASATPEHYTRTIEVVGADPGIDAVVVIYIPPLVTKPEEVAQAIAERLRASRFLDGYRGAPPADRDALVSIILRVSALLESVPELLELDLN